MPKRRYAKAKGPFRSEVRLNPVRVTDLRGKSARRVAFPLTRSGKLVASNKRAPKNPIRHPMDHNGIAALRRLGKPRMGSKRTRSYR